MYGVFCFIEIGSLVIYGSNPSQKKNCNKDSRSRSERKSEDIVIIQRGILLVRTDKEQRMIVQLLLLETMIIPCLISLLLTLLVLSTKVKQSESQSHD